MRGLLLALLAALAGVPTHAAPPEPLVVAMLPIAASALLIIAQRQGYFHEQGLRVELLTVESGRAALDALQSGRARFATSSETPFGVALLHGGEPCVVAQMASAADINSLLGRRDLGVESVADLAGKRVGVVPGTNSEFFLDAALMLHEVPSAAVTRVPLSPREMASALIEGRVDALSGWEPHLEPVAARLGNKAFVFRSAWLYHMSYMLSTTREFAQAHGAQVTAMLKALQQALEFIRQHPVQAAQGVSERLGDGRGLALHADRFALRLDQSLPESLELQLAWAARQEARSPGPELNVLAYICEAPLRAAVPGAVTLIPAQQP